MSAWRVGSELQVRVARPGGAGVDIGGGPAGQGGTGGGGGGGNGGDGDGLKAVLDRITKWIPGDVLALYVAAVTAFQAKSGAKPSWVLLVVFIALAVAVVVLSTFATSGSIPSKVWLPAGLAGAAFTIWSLSVPFSGWQRWGAVHDNQAAVAVVAAGAALVFSLIADGLTKRFGSG